MKTPGNYFKVMAIAILFSFPACRLVVFAQTVLPDSLIFKSAILDTSETFRQGYFTAFGHNTINSYFKEPNGDEHLAYVDNYKLYYFKSTDDGNSWSRQQIITSHEGDIYNCALTVDTAGSVFIGITANNNFNYANPTAVSFGSEFYYDLYSITNKTGNWVTELVNTHPGNYGARIAGLFVDQGNNVHIVANYYGWNSLGGTAWEWIRNASSNIWGAKTTIATFADIAIDRVIYDTYTIVPDQKGNVTLVMCRNISKTTTDLSRLFYVRHNGTSWSAPVTVSDTIAVAWNRFDALVDTAGHTYIAYMKYKTPGVPVLKIMKDFEPAHTASLNLSPNDTLYYFRMHCNAQGLFTMYLYLNKKNTKICTTFSRDALNWSDPVPTPDNIKKYLGGMIVKTDTRRGHFTDYCKQIVTTAGPRTVQPYGPDTLLYGSLKLLGIPSTPGLTLPLSDAAINTQSVSFQWTSSQPEISRYWIEIDVSSQFDSPFIDSTLTVTNYMYDQIESGETYFWRVKARNQRGWGQFSAPNWFNTNFVSIGNEVELARKTSLEQNTPNPFTPTTTIRYTLYESSIVSLTLYDLRGQIMATLLNEYKPSGKYELKFDATSLPAGIYFYTLQTGDFVKTRKMILLK